MPRNEPFDDRDRSTRDLLSGSVLSPGNMRRMVDSVVAQQVRDALQGALRAFRERPFDDMREGDPQGLIFSELRRTVTPADTALTLRHLRPNAHSYAEGARTHRVHRELKLHDDWKLDIAIFRCDQAVEMVVHWNGPLDILATARGEDLAAVIEVKAAPSKNMWGAFRDDLAKLSSITNAYPECQGFFVAFDKSLALGGTTSMSRPSFKWLDALLDDAEGRVEAHFLNSKHEPSWRRGRIQNL